MSPPTCPSILSPSYRFFCGVSRSIPMSSLLAVSNIISSHTCTEATSLDPTPCCDMYPVVFLVTLGGPKQTPPQASHTKYHPPPHPSPRQPTIPQPPYCYLISLIMSSSTCSYHITVLYSTDNNHLSKEFKCNIRCKVIFVALADRTAVNFAICSDLLMWVICTLLQHQLSWYFAEWRKIQG